MVGCKGIRVDESAILSGVEYRGRSFDGRKEQECN